MAMPVEYRYVIDGLTPARLPMARLAGYMRQLATLLGEPEHVHFDRIEAGSMALVSIVDDVAVERVGARLQSLLAGHAPAEAYRAAEILDVMLAQDGAAATLIDDRGYIRVAFQGRDRPKPITYGPFDQDGTLHGIILRVGLLTEQVAYAFLQDNSRIYACRLSVELAAKLAGHLSQTVRVTGRGRWYRDEHGAWHPERFDIFSFEALDDSSLLEVVARLQAVPNNGWRLSENPLKKLEDIRGSDD